MKYKFLVSSMALVLGTCIACWASDDGAALYKKKCAGCHGPQGEGKPALKAPSLKGTTMDVSQLVQHITKGEATSKTPHNKAISGVSEEQGKAIADYVKTFK